MGQKPGRSTELAKPLTEEEIWARICLTGNLAGINDIQRMAYYERYCRHLDLDPITRPFDLITTYDTDPETGERREKTVLYANASCSAQLANKRHITYGIPVDNYDPDLGTITIKVMASFAVGDVNRSCWRRGVAHVAGLKGKWLENAIKKAETQAHRRATLALCGVAMSDESEIEDIDGAEASEIVARVGDPSEDIADMIGTYLKAAGQEDNAASRAFVLAGIESGAFQAVANNLRVPIDVVLNMNKRRLAKTAAVEPPPDPQEVKEHICEAVEEARDKIEGVKREETAIKEEIEETRKKEAASATENAVADIPITLTPAQQKAADAFMVVVRDYKRLRADVLGVVGKFLGRKIERSADLDEAEAVRVAKWLNAWISKLEKNKKASPSWEFDQSYRNHDDATAARLDDVYRRLVALQIPGQTVLDKMQEVLIRIGAPVTNTRYAIADDDAAQVCEHFEEWADDLEKDKIQ